MNEIMAAPELLRIEPQGPKISQKAQNIAIAIVSLVYGLIAFKIIGAVNIELVFTTVAYMTLICAVILIRKGGTPFIITGKGIMIYPYVAEFWEDIESYTWETFTGYTRLPLQPAQSVTTLYLVNKGGILRQRNIENRTGHTVLGNCGIFFSPEQIASTDKLFQEHGIRKITTESKTSAQQNAPGDAG